MKRTGTTNPHLKSLIQELKTKSSTEKINLWKRVAEDLELPTRRRRVVNLSRINKFTKENEIVIVPGKVLGSGSIAHKIKIAAWDYSRGALEKINQVGEAVSIRDIMKDDIKGKRVRILG